MYSNICKYVWQVLYLLGKPTCMYIIHSDTIVLHTRSAKCVERAYSVKLLLVLRICPICLSIFFSIRNAMRFEGSILKLCPFALPCALLFRGLLHFVRLR